MTKRSQFWRRAPLLVLNFCLQIVLIYCISALFLALPFWPNFFFGVTDPLRFLGFYSSIYIALEIVWKGFQSIPLYPTNELAHLVDVHWLVVKAMVLVTILLGLIKLIQVKIPRRIWQIAFFSWIGLTATILLTFPFFFETFHQLLFPQGNYAFDPSSRLIQTFPLNFWIASFVVLQIMVIAWLGWKVSRAAPEKF